MISEEHQERRRTSRLRIYRPVRLHAFVDRPAIETLTKDLAMGGLRCLSPIEFPVSTELTVEFQLAGGEEPVTVRGRMAWFRTIPYSDQFELGIAFLQPSQVTIRRLSGYLDHLAPSPAHALH